jgi:hypothetical protein
MTRFTGQSLPDLTLDPDSASRDRRSLVVARHPAEIKAGAAWRCGLAKRTAEEPRQGNFERKEKGWAAFVERRSYHEHCLNE